MQLKRLPILAILTASGLVAPRTTAAQSPRAATYITDEEVKAVNATPGIDRTIKVVDIGNENFAVGIIHRGASGGGGAAARGAGAAGAGGAAGGAGAASAAAPAPVPAAEACGQQASGATTGGTPGISHDSQTEGYLIVSGGGTLVTGGTIVNGRKSAPDGAVTKELNGPSCSGTIIGPDVVKRQVKTGDIIIIPAGVAHGWSDITDHVDYLSFRPSARVLQAGYVHPAIRR